MFMVDGFEDVVDMVVYGSYDVESFFCGARGEFVVVIEVHGVCIKAIETSEWGEFVGHGGCGIVGKFCKR